MGNITQRLMLMKRIICTGFLLIRMPREDIQMQDQAVALFEAATTKIVYR